MGGPKNSFFHLKLIEKMSFYLNSRAHKGQEQKRFKSFCDCPYGVKRGKAP
jgi:hypothetical protein